MRIHRGAAEIGGAVIELEVEGDRLVLEAGLPLTLDKVAYRDLQPDVPGIWSDGDGTLKGLVITHGHPDHYGLADLVSPRVPIYMGEAAKAIIDEAAFFNRRQPGFELSGHLEDQRPISIGRFTITPFLVDHSRSFRKKQLSQYFQQDDILFNSALSAGLPGNDYPARFVSQGDARILERVAA